MKLLLPLLLFVLIGCHNISAPPAVTAHVSDTLRQLQPFEAPCAAGDADQCSAILAMSTSEMLYLTDPNTGVSFSREYGNQTRLLTLQLSRLLDRCLDANDDLACTKGAPLGKRALIVVLNGLNDSNLPSE